MKRTTRPSGKRDLAVNLIVAAVTVPIAWAVEEEAHSKGAGP